MQQDVGELVLEHLGLLGVGEVAALAAPAGDGAGDAADHLLDRALARRVADLPAEVLLGDDVGRILRPVRGELDVLLLERHAIAVADARVAQLPVDGVERMQAGRGEEARDFERAGGRRLLGVACACGWGHRPSFSAATGVADAYSRLFVGAEHHPAEAGRKDKQQQLLF